MTHYGLVGNCQSREIGKCFTALDRGARRHVVLIQQLRIASDEKKREWLEKLRTCDAVFTQVPEIKSLGPFSRASLESEKLRVVPFPSVLFAGLFPDFTTIRHGGGMLPSPIGKGHSAIVAAGFLEGLPEERVLKLFNSFTYASLRYFEMHGLSRRFMERLEASTGYDLSFLFESSGKRTMKTFSHPTIETLYEVARQALSKIGVIGKDGPLPEDRTSNRWPIYPEIAERAGLHHNNREAFAEALSSDLATTRSLSREEFVAESYAGYREVKEDIFARHIERARAFIRENVIVSGKSSGAAPSKPRAG